VASLCLQVYDSRLTGDYLCGECKIDPSAWKDFVVANWQGLKNERNEFGGQIKYSLKFMAADIAIAHAEQGNSVR
jgi:hypothetical protein